MPHLVPPRTHSAVLSPARDDGDARDRRDDRARGVARARVLVLAAPRDDATARRRRRRRRRDPPRARAKTRRPRTRVVVVVVVVVVAVAVAAVAVRGRRRAPGVFARRPRDQRPGVHPRRQRREDLDRAHEPVAVAARAVPPRRSIRARQVHAPHARQARSYSHWSPYDRVRVVNADP